MTTLKLFSNSSTSNCDEPCDAGRRVGRKRFIFRLLADRDRSDVYVNHEFVLFPPAHTIKEWSWTGLFAVTL